MQLKTLFFAIAICCACIVNTLTIPSPVLASEQSGPILIFPFEINSGKGMEHLTDELPALIRQRLAARGITVVPDYAVEAFIQQEKLATLDLSTVRELIRKSGAEAAVYGSFNQLGESFSIDARLVTEDPRMPAKTFFVEQSSTGNLLIAVDELATRIANELLKHSSISHIEVRGTKNLDPDIVLLRINTKKGDFVDPRLLDRELKKIWELGFFSDIVVHIEQTDDGLHLIYTIKEKPRVEKVVIQGNDELDDSDIRSIMTTKPGATLNDKVLAADLQKIQEQYRKKGYYLARISPQIEISSNESSATLSLNIEEGNLLYIQNVVIEGAKEVSAGKIKDELALSERGLFSWFTGSGILKEELLERDSSAISSYYMDLGFMDIEVDSPRVEYLEDGIVITHKVHEGKRYKVGAVRCAGDLIDSDSELAKLTILDDIAKDDGYFSLAKLHEDVRALTDYYAEYGYAFAQVSPRPEKNEAEGVVDITYIIAKNQKVYVRNIILEGNQHTRDNVVLREMQLVDGDSFDGKKLAMSMRRLNKIGHFEIAESELVPTKNPGEVDLKIKLKERNTGSIIGGVGYSTYSQFGVTASIQESNLWGKGYFLGLQAQFSSRRTAYDLSFTNPNLNDTPLSVGFDLYNWKDDFYDYRKKTAGGGVRTSYPLGNYSRVGLGYRLEFYKLYDFEDDASWMIRKYKGNRMASVLSARFTRDTTDALLPSNGTVLNLSTEYGGGLAGGDDNFIILSGEHHIYYGLNERNILHLKTVGKMLLKNNSKEVPIYERFWMGGIGSVRGYKSSDIVPRDKETGDRIGGTRMAYANAEYIWNISQELGFNLVPFYDIGVNIDTDHAYKLSDQIKQSVGMELRWRSPLGDLRFSYGVPLSDDWYGKRAKPRFEFSMGNFF